MRRQRTGCEGGKWSRLCSPGTLGGVWALQGADLAPTRPGTRGRGWAMQDAHPTKREMRGGAGSLRQAFANILVSTVINGFDRMSMIAR
jgi:hypothetical protein